MSSHFDREDYPLTVVTNETPRDESLGGYDEVSEIADAVAEACDSRNWIGEYFTTTELQASDFAEDGLVPLRVVEVRLQSSRHDEISLIRVRRDGGPLHWRVSYEGDQRATQRVMNLSLATVSAAVAQVVQWLDCHAPQTGVGRP